MASCREAGQRSRHEERGNGRMESKMGNVLVEAKRNVRHLVTDESGQGTTEYAILVGVLVVIAILSIVTFRGKVQELWDAIANGFGSL